MLLDDPARRDAYVTGIFDLIAPRYDRFTRWFSYGMDRAWKRDVVRAAGEALQAADEALRTGAGPSAEPGTRRPLALDLACGTGDLAIGAARAAPHAGVVGLDASRPMLERAVARARAEMPRGSGPRTLHFVAGSMADLPLPDGSVDLVTAGYGLRNAPALDRALDEIARVLRPGGTLVTLDFFLPATRAWREAFLGYLTVAGWVYGQLWHGRPDAYVYIPRSIRRFVTAADYERALQRRDLRLVRAQRHLLGGVAVHVAVKAR